MKGQNTVTVESSFSLHRMKDIGGSLAWGMYGNHDYWSVKARFNPFTQHYDSRYDVQYVHATVGADWMWRIVSDRRRIVSLYGGGGVFLGAEIIDPWKRLPKHLEVNGKKTVFLYGIDATVSMEVYFTKRTAFVLSSWIPLTIPSSARPVHFVMDAGVRVSF